MRSKTQFVATQKEACSSRKMGYQKPAVDQFSERRNLDWKLGYGSFMSDTKIFSKYINF